MGYSCSVKASIALRVIQSLDEFDVESPNYKYHVEIGKEHKHGAITGSVYELLGEWCTKQNGFKSQSCRKIGSFKIASDGEIVRFPGLSKRMFGVVQIQVIETYDRQYSRDYWKYVETSV